MQTSPFAKPPAGLSQHRVSQWERGEKHPQGASLKLLTLVEKNGLQALAQGMDLRLVNERRGAFSPVKLRAPESRYTG